MVSGEDVGWHYLRGLGGASHVFRHFELKSHLL